MLFFRRLHIHLIMCMVVLLFAGTSKQFFKTAHPIKPPFCNMKMCLFFAKKQSPPCKWQKDLPAIWWKPSQSTKDLNLVLSKFSFRFPYSCNQHPLFRTEKTDNNKRKIKVLSLWYFTISVKVFQVLFTNYSWHPCYASAETAEVIWVDSGEVTPPTEEIRIHSVNFIE